MFYSCSLLAISRRQNGMQRRHNLRPLADRRGDALYRTRAHIADRKDTRSARLQRLTVLGSARAGQYKSLTVQRYARSGQPIRVRVGSDEEEQMLNRPPHFLS